MKGWCGYQWISPKLREYKFLFPSFSFFIVIVILDDFFFFFFFVIMIIAQLIGICALPTINSVLVN